MIDRPATFPAIPSPLRRRRRLPGAVRLPAPGGSLAAPVAPRLAGAPAATPVAPLRGVLGMGTSLPGGSAGVDSSLGGWLQLPEGLPGALLGPLWTAGIALPPGIARRTSNERFQQLLALADARPDLAWKAGRTLAMARNAHSTNTDEELQNALANEYDWLEGDIRRERDGTLVMAHGLGDKDGLSLDEWITVGARSGRGLKLDIKEAAAIVPAVRRARQLGVPESKLIVNVTVVGNTAEVMQLRQLREVRRLYPGATVNLSVQAARYDDEVVDTLVRWAVEAGQPVMFPLRLDLVTDDVIRRLKPYGRVAIFNTPMFSAPSDLEEAVAELRARGVNGTIDLRTAGTWERVARPFVKASLSVFGWGATVAMLRIGAFFNWMSA